MHDELEQLEAVVINAFRLHEEQLRRQGIPWVGLIPGEPVEGDRLERATLDGSSPG